MPPRQRFSQQTIIDAAIRVIREQGPEALNARKLAGELGCSTQPLYSLFSSMEGIEQAVITACLPIPMEYMLGAEDRESQFLSIGMGYLQFAESEPGIFRLLFTSGKVQWDFTAGNPTSPRCLRRCAGTASLPRSPTGSSSPCSRRCSSSPTDCAPCSTVPVSQIRPGP